MEKLSETKILKSKSKFCGYLFKINSTEEIKKIVEEISDKNKKARHICYAVSLKDEEIFKNNGEVGNPGKILLKILKNKNLNKNILIVARIYGGVKLGPTGVGKAFREVGNKCVVEKEHK